MIYDDILMPLQILGLNYKDNLIVLYSVVVLAACIGIGTIHDYITKLWILLNSSFEMNI